MSKNRDDILAARGWPESRLRRAVVDAANTSFDAGALALLGYQTLLDDAGREVERRQQKRQNQ